MPESSKNRPGDQQTSGRPAGEKAKPGADAFAAQESGASGGPAPTSDELCGREPGESAGENAADAQSNRPGASEPTRDSPRPQRTSSKDADPEYEAGDQSEGVDKRMD